MRCPSITSHFQFLQSYHKMSLIKVAWYVLRVKNIHSWSPSDLWSSWGQDSMLLYIIRQKAKLNIHTWKLTLFHIFHSYSVGPKQLCVQLVLPSYYHNLINLYVLINWINSYLKIGIWLNKPPTIFINAFEVHPFGYNRI